jgi:flavodoxin
MKKIVIYYSHSDHSKLIASHLNGDKREIKLEKQLPRNMFLLMIVGGYYSIFGKNLALEKMDVDINQYDEITLITPVWAGKPASPMQSFLNSIKFKNKKVRVIFSYGGSEGRSASVIKDLIDESNTIQSIEGYKESTFDKVICES